MAYLSVGVRCLLALVFAVSVVSKVRGAASFRAFVDSLDATRLLPRRATGPTAVVLVAAEATAAALLGPPATARVGLALAALTAAWPPRSSSFASTTSSTCSLDHEDAPRPRSVPSHAEVLTHAVPDRRRRPRRLPLPARPRADARGGPPAARPHRAAHRTVRR